MSRRRGSVRIEPHLDRGPAIPEPATRATTRPAAVEAAPAPESRRQVEPAATPPTAPPPPAGRPASRPAGKAAPPAKPQPAHTKPAQTKPAQTKPAQTTPGQRRAGAIARGGSGGATSAEAVRRLRRRQRLTPLTRRILTLNILALVIPVVGLLYLGEYRDNLVQAELEALTTEAQLFAGALGTSGVVVGPLGEERLVADASRPTVRRLVEASKRRARLFAPDGSLLADSNRLMGPGGQVEIEVLPAPRAQSPWESLIAGVYDWVVSYVPSSRTWPPYTEQPSQRAEHYPETQRALAGEIGSAVREDGGGGLVLSVAVPVQRYRQVLGSLLLTTGSEEIDAAVRDVRLDVLKIFGIALAITILLSLYLARTIARPIHRLAEAAERVRHGHGRQTVIPDFPRRRDEIGDLSAALKDMTEALWLRMDAIERFAADVAHEIKNPLTSLRSAVETAARIEDPLQQRKLMSIILDDVQRLDRLISDISDASRLDAELSRAEAEPVDVGRLLETLARVHEATATAESPRFEIEVARHQNLMVDGIDSRLGQVFRNLINNAVSFSPPGGIIRIRAARERDVVRVSVTDQGPGLPEGKLEAIFDRFYSERPAGEKFGTHSGLGLSISKQIVEAHGGTIVAANRLDENRRVSGARFTVNLPAAGQ